MSKAHFPVLSWCEKKSDEIDRYVSDWIPTIRPEVWAAEFVDSVSAAKELAELLCQEKTVRRPPKDWPSQSHRDLLDDVLDYADRIDAYENGRDFVERDVIDGEFSKKVKRLDISMLSLALDKVEAERKAKNNGHNRDTSKKTKRKLFNSEPAECFCRYLDKHRKKVESPGTSKTEWARRFAKEWESKKTQKAPQPASLVKAANSHLDWFRNRE
jgi:hypothetical protein